MQANELRIGNWLIFDTEHNGKMALPVTVLREDQICSGFTISYYDDPIIEPIELTPEILEKAGFSGTENDLNLSISSSDGILNFSDDYLSLFVNSATEHGYERFAMLHIKYLHQLQNLYHSLTGEELTINL